MMDYQVSILSGAMKVIWILISIIFSAGFTQRIISPEPGTLRNLCPGEEVNITCETRGSPIIAWTSDVYIETGGTQLEFASFSSIGDTSVSPVNPNTIAILVNNTIEGGMQVLVSQLRIIVSDDSGIIRCINVGGGTSTAVSIQTLGDPEVPEAIARQTLDASGNCTVHLTLNAPNNLAPGDISHYTVKINDTQLANETKNENTNLTLGVYPLCSCGSHNISINTVNRCGTAGQSTLNIIVEDPLRQIPTCENSTPITGGNKECQVLPWKIATITLSIITIITVITSVICICITRKKLYEYEKKRRQRSEYYDHQGIDKVFKTLHPDE